VKFLPRPKKSFSPEFKDEAVKMVIETSRPIARVAKELGINEGTLGNWVSAYRREHAGEEPPLAVNERARLRELERETREQKMELEFLKKAAGMRLNQQQRKGAGYSRCTCRNPSRIRMTRTGTGGSTRTWWPGVAFSRPLSAQPAATGQASVWHGMNTE
jgi:transposase